ncbi:Hypothetical protein DPCES_1398 [Desulfitobacterium hafniense]|uniref:Uncharacterized protein n=1 Tax=Desulfitobacterium hafniense TaxID=49338 RepID=A0A098AYT9_DESHA|nr:hypothetical protein [Desulfitobacterium hafniense]CDX01285.1 Hypothetical protein DPCES_1398 [Desulfitobacterium hafniense]
MLTEEHLQDAVKCDGSRARCKECWMLNYMGQDDCVRRLAETAIKLKAELETEKALHHKCEKLALKNAMGYDEVKAERDKAVKCIESIERLARMRQGLCRDGTAMRVEVEIKQWRGIKE